MSEPGAAPGPAAIAAYRAGNAPHILQVFEVGTATMMSGKGAIVPAGKVLADAGYKVFLVEKEPSIGGIMGAAIAHGWPDELLLDFAQAPASHVAQGSP